MKIFLLGCLLAVAAVLAGARFGLFAGQRPHDLGVADGRLKAPAVTPNSVSSQTALHPGHPQADYARIAPLALRGQPPAAAMRALAGLLRTTPGITVIVARDDYIHAEARTPWLGFVDDLEFHAAGDAAAIDLRSASRLGRKDFGVNRRRIEALRGRWETGALR